MRTFNSLTGRIIAGGLLIHAILIPLLFIGTVFIVREGFQSRFIDQVRSNSYLFATMLSKERNPERIAEILEDAMIGGQLVFAELIDENGRHISGEQQTDDRPPFAEDFFFGQHGDQVYFIALPLPEDSEPPRILRLGYDETPVIDQIGRTHTLFLYLVVGYIVALLLLSGIFGRLIARPLQRLRQEAQKIASGIYERRLDVHSSITEIVSLSQDLETMRRNLVRHNRELEHQSLHDALTGLPNRVLLQDRLRQALSTARRSGHRLALFMIDLDGFKEINDTLGHHNGDLLLQQVATRMRSVLRPMDTIARLGGDEFAVLVTEIADKAAATTTARRLVRSLEQPILLEDRPLRVGMSIGIALYPEHGTDETTLMRLADVAMYVAKRNQIDYSFYDAARDGHSLGRLSLAGELRDAIAQGELELHYQPVIGLHHGGTSAVEALVRWRHPQRGLVMPDEFIPLAEQSGLIRPLFTWVLDEALRQCAAWEGDGTRLPVSVNLSARNLHDPELPDQVRDLLAKHGLRAGLLTLEITENAFIADPAMATENLERLHAMGVALSVDDFGTGYSSLPYLKRLPIGEIKIDRSYVASVSSSHDDEVIVRSTIELAHNLGIEVVAEGVESRQILDILTDLGCDKAQGRYFSQALDAPRLTQWLRRTAAERHPPGGALPRARG